MNTSENNPKNKILSEEEEFVENELKFDGTEVVKLEKWLMFKLKFGPLQIIDTP